MKLCQFQTHTIIKLVFIMVIMSIFCEIFYKYSNNINQYVMMKVLLHRSHSGVKTFFINLKSSINQLYKNFEKQRRRLFSFEKKYLSTPIHYFTSNQNTLKNFPKKVSNLCHFSVWCHNNDQTQELDWILVKCESVYLNSDLGRLKLNHFLRMWIPLAWVGSTIALHVIRVHFGTLCPIQKTKGLFGIQFRKKLTLLHFIESHE